MQPASTKTPCDFYVCKYRNIPHIPYIHPYTHTPIHHKVKRTVEEKDHTVEQIQRDSLWSSQGKGNCTLDIARYDQKESVTRCSHHSSPYPVCPPPGGLGVPWESRTGTVEKSHMSPSPSWPPLHFLDPRSRSPTPTI